MRFERFLFLYKLLHLLYEIMLYLCQLKQFVGRRAFSERLIHYKLTLARRRAQHRKQLVLCLFGEVLCAAETVAPCFKAAYRLLECFLICFSYAHDLADSAHLRAELVLRALEFLKRPACELDNDIFAVGVVFVESAVFPAGDIREIETRCEHCRNESYREARSL